MTYFHLRPRFATPSLLALLLAGGFSFGAAGPSAAQTLTLTPYLQNPPQQAPVVLTAQERAAERAAVRASQQAERRARAEAARASQAQARAPASPRSANLVTAEAPLAPAELAIAELVHTGVLPCELGAFITLESDLAMPGYFNVSGKNFRFRMVPVVSTTGAVRLEDREAGAVWLQLANKSMLMNQRVGRRMADECLSPAQAAQAQHMKTNPGPGLLDMESQTGAAVPAATPRARGLPRVMP